jgi:hypothetical protein
MSERSAGESGPARPGERDVIDWRAFDPSWLPEGESSPLAAELVTYRDHLDELLRHEGQFVVIKGGSIRGFYRSRRAALDAAFKQYGRVPVLVKRVVEMEPVHRLGNAAP